MNNGLLTQLADYGSDHEERQRAVTADEIVGSVVPLPIRTSRAIAPRSIGIAVAAAAIVLAVVALPLVFTSSDAPPAESTTVPDQPSTTVVPTTTPETPTAVAAPAPIDPSTPPTIEWTEITFEAGEGPSAYAQVHATPDGFMAYDPGYEEWDGAQFVDIDGDTRNIMWTSTDGVTWTEQVFEVPTGDVATRATFVGVVGDFYVMTFWIDNAAGCNTCISTDLVTWSSSAIDLPYPGVWQPAIVGNTVAFHWGGNLVITDLAFEDATIVGPSETASSNPFVRADTTIESLHASVDRFYVTTYAYTPFEEGGPEEGPTCGVWSSSDGLNWHQDLTDLCNGPMVLGAYEDVVFASIGGELWRAESGRDFVSLGTANLPDGEDSLTGIDGGFILTVTEELTFTEWATRTYVTADGTEWVEVDALDAAPITWITSGSLVLGQSGDWWFEIDGEASEIMGVPMPASGGWDSDGSWVIGTVTPPG